jgi:pimeloyl-ACP methyl ester carboxylesterase
VFDRLLAVAAGGDPPTDTEIAQQYAPPWLAEVTTGPALFSEFAPIVGAAVMAYGEESRLNEARLVLELGGDGPLLLLLHGSGCDATAWEGMVPHLRSFRVLAQDLPGHGASPLPRLSVTEAIADAEALLDELSLGDPILVGHSLGGWIALHHAATRDRFRGLVCLDGPTALDFSAMGLEPDHPGFVPDPPEVATDLEALRCPTLITLCAGTSPAEAEWMVPFRQGLSDHIARSPHSIRVEWQPTGHMMCAHAPEADGGRRDAVRARAGGLRAQVRHPPKCQSGAARSEDNLSRQGGGRCCPSKLRALRGPVELGSWNADRTPILFGVGSSALIAAGVPEDPTGEHDEGLVVGAEVAVPTAIWVQGPAECLGEGSGLHVGCLKVDEGPRQRLTCVRISGIGA